MCRSFTPGALALGLASGCAWSTAEDDALRSMTVEEHLRAAEREHRLADEEFEKIRDGRGVEPAQRLPGEVAPVTTPFDSSIEPGEPEYYTVDPRVRDPDEKHVDAAREHRRKAEWHEAQAERKRHLH